MKVLKLTPLKATASSPAAHLFRGITIMMAPMSPLTRYSYSSVYLVPSSTISEYVIAMPSYESEGVALARYSITAIRLGTASWREEP